jgi:hypothetical protein
VGQPLAEDPTEAGSRRARQRDSEVPQSRHHIETSASTACLPSWSPPCCPGAEGPALLE